MISKSQVSIEQKSNRAFLFGPGTTLQDIVKAINAVGATPADLVAILEALKQAGALSASLEII